MSALTDKLNIDNADAYYAELIELIESRPEDKRPELMASLILLLSNAVADRAVLDEILNIARAMPE